MLLLQVRALSRVLQQRVADIARYTPNCLSRCSFLKITANRLSLAGDGLVSSERRERV